MTCKYARIELTGPGAGRVFLEGREVVGVTALSLHAQVERPNVLTLSILVREVTVTGPVEVERIPRNIGESLAERGTNEGHPGAEPASIPE